MAKSKANDTTIKRVFMYLAAIVAVLLLGIGGLAYWAHSFIGSMVQHELSVQKIYFPESGSPALDPDTFPGLQQYAGQLVDTPAKAKAYANEYIGQHLKDTADGKSYAEISTEARQNPTNQTLQQQKQTLFQGETLRGILLTSGYGFGTIGNVAGIAALVSVLGAVALGATALMIRARL